MILYKKHHIPNLYQFQSFMLNNLKDIPIVFKKSINNLGQIILTLFKAPKDVI